MKKLVILLVIGLLVGAAQANLSVDFGKPAGPLESGFQAFEVADNYNLGDLTKTYSAFGTTVSVKLRQQSGRS